MGGTGGEIGGGKGGGGEGLGKVRLGLCDFFASLKRPGYWGS